MLPPAGVHVLFRMGVSGDRDRDREEAARTYFAEHGSWPADAGSGKRGWRLPENVATPESEARERRGPEEIDGA